MPHRFSRVSQVVLNTAVCCLVCIATAIGGFAQEIKTLPLSPADSARSDRKVRLRIVSFNDFHGNYKEKDIAVGGPKFVAALNEYANDFARDYPTALCVMGAGDFSTGTAMAYYSMFDSVTGGQKPGNAVATLFERTHLVCACIGNHEFDWGAAYLEDHLAKAIVVIDETEFSAYSSANVINNATGWAPGGISPYDIISPRDTGVNIAVISLTTLETVIKSMPGATEGYTVLPPGECARKYVERLRDEVDGFVFLTHMAAYQDDEGRVTFGGDTDEMLELIRLKPLAIISAHSHKLVAGEADGVPIVQAANFGNGLASVNLIIDPDTKAISVESRECVDLLAKRDSLPADAEMLQLIERFEREQAYETVGTVPEPLGREKFGFSPLGTFIAKGMTRAFRKTTGNEPVLAFQHSGGIRANLPSGTMTTEQCFDLHPFGNHLCLCRLPGDDVLRLIREGLTNPNGYLQSSGLTFYYDAPDAKRTDFQFVTHRHDGRDFVIEPHLEYWVVVDLFVALGGDGYGRDIFEGRIVDRDGPFPRDVLADFVRDELRGDARLRESWRVRQAVLAPGFQSVSH